MICTRSTIERLESRLFLAAQAYDWKNANIGAGGFVSGVFFDPTKQNVIYARTDIGGLYKTTNGGTNWRQLLDFANNTTDHGFEQLGVLSFAMNPRNTDQIYADVGLYNDKNGWVLRSSDGGYTFTVTDLPFYVGGNSAGRGTGERLAVDPNLGTTLFLGSNDHGLYKSTNGAVSFAPVGSFPLPTAHVTFVYLDPRSGTLGNATQTLYAGVASTAAGTNIYRSMDGGSTWAALPGGPTGLMPMQAVLASDGNLYFTFSNDTAPTGNITNGSVWRYNTATSAWLNISPQAPGVAGAPNFGYDGIAVDPQNPNAVVVTSFDRYSGPDTIWRSANAAAATPTWIQLFDPSSAQNFGFGGFNTTRNTSAAPWVAAYGDGIGNWASYVAIDPFNSAHLMYTTGQGIWATDHADSATMLTAPNSWYFPDTGIEFTAVLKIVAPPTGTPLFSVMGDINGFAHTSLTSSPAAGGIGATITNGGLGTMNSIDFAQSNSNILAAVGQVGARHGLYTLNNGTTWTEFAARPNNNANGGTVAVSASGSTFLWAASGKLPFYSTSNGQTWTAAAMPGGTLTGGTVVADRFDSNRFYYWTENGSNNQWTLYGSTDAGHNFIKGPTIATGSATLVANPSTAGDLWISTYNGVYHSTDFGANFTLNSAVGNTNIVSMALGRPAPAQSYPAIYIYGISGAFKGVFRSDDTGTTWTQINDTARQFGGLIKTMAGDPNVYGRVYMGVDGRGVLYGDIHTGPASFPMNWSTQDIGSPGSAGSAGGSSGAFEVIGGGLGIPAGGANSDQFRYAYTNLSGDGSITARVVSNPLAAPTNNNSKAGVMIRNTLASNSAHAFMAMTPGAVNGAVFQSRSTIGGATSTTNFTGVWNPYWVRLTRSGSSFTAERSADGVSWVQVGSTQSISMNTNVFIGLAVTASDNTQLDIATFDNVSVNVVASPLTITGTPGPDAIRLVRNGAMTDVLFGASVQQSFDPATVSVLTINSLAGDDVVTLDFSNGNPLPTSTAVDGGDDVDTLAIVGASTAEVATFSASSLSVAGVPATHSNAETVSFDGAGGADDVTVNVGASLTIPTTQHLNSLTVDGTAIVSPDLSSGLGIRTSALSVTGSLDLTNNDLILDYSGASQLAAVQGLIGTKLISSSAIAKPTTTLGAIESSEYRSIWSESALFDGESIGNTAVLVKYTWNGDTNFSGSVDFDDYVRVDVGFNTGRTGWLNGDFNRTGTIDFDDYVLIDVAFNLQDGVL